MHKAIFTGVCALFWLTSTASAQQDKAQLDESAKKIAERFGRDLFSRNAAEALKSTATPFLTFDKEWKRGMGDFAVLKTADDVKKELELIVSKIPNGFLDMAAEVTFRTQTCEDAIANDVNLDKDDVRKGIDAVAKKTDRLMGMSVRLKDGPKESLPLISILVGWRAGQPKVVGWLPTTGGPSEKIKQ